MSLAERVAEARHDGRQRGGYVRVESICPRCHADLSDGQCPFCEHDPRRWSFERGDQAAREFLYRCGVVR